MSPLLNPARTPVSIPDQQPTSTHPCFNDCLAPTQRKPMCPLLISNQQAHTHVCVAHQHPTSTHMSPFLISNQRAHTHVSVADLHQASAHPCVHCWPTTNKHAHPCLHAGQHPTSTHPCLHCQSAANKHTFMCLLRISTQPAHPHACTADRQPTSTHPCFHCFSAPMKIPRVVPQNGFPYKSNMAAGPLPY